MHRFWRCWSRAILVIGLAICGHPGRAQAPSWTVADALALLRTIEAVREEGLDPKDYDPDQLQLALKFSDAGKLNEVATATFMRLGGDFIAGHVRASDRLGWHLTGSRVDPLVLDGIMRNAITNHQISAALHGLLPVNPDYLALRAALAATSTTDVDKTLRLRANLERWRWMPRDLGDSYILVNVAGFTLDLVIDGKRAARHRVIVGKPSTPTPQFDTQATGLIINPWWEVPQSIVAESVGRLVRTRPAFAKAQGYVATAATDGRRIRQAPGPANALGQLKLTMPNPFSVYIHDTPAKSLFDKAVRAFSHGCIRTDRVADLAESLLHGSAGWDRQAIDTAIASRRTASVELARPLPIYIAYFTAATDDLGQVVQFDDIYRRDGPVIAALIDRAGQDDVD